MKILAAVLREHGDKVSVEQIELTAPKEKEVLVKTAYTGFCHSDLHFIEGKMNFPLPLVVGHECSGIVEAVGPGVTAVKKGDHVVPVWMFACGTCPDCVKGLGHICRTSNEIHGTGGLLDRTSRLSDLKGNRLSHMTFVSGFAEYMVVPEQGAIKIRDDMPMDQACLLGCCLPTGFGAVYNAAGVKPGQSVAIWGMGGVGLNVVQGARIRNAYPIIGVDLEASKEKIAREFGCTHFINNSKEDPVPIIKEKLTNGGADFCFEVIGDSGAVTQAVWSLGMGGKLVQIGLTPEEEMTGIPHTYTPLHAKSIEGTLYGNINPERDIPTFVNMAMNGDFKLDKLITKVFKINEINDVIKAMQKREIVGRWVCKW